MEYEQRYRFWVSQVVNVTRLPEPLTKLAVDYGASYQDVWVEGQQAPDVPRRKLLRQDYDWFTELPDPVKLEPILHQLQTLPSNVEWLADRLAVLPDTDPVVPDESSITSGKRKRDEPNLETKSGYLKWWQEHLLKKAADQRDQEQARMAQASAVAPLRRTWFLDEKDGPHKLCVTFDRKHESCMNTARNHESRLIIDRKHESWVIVTHKHIIIDRKHEACVAIDLAAVYGLSVSAIHFDAVLDLRNMLSIVADTHNHCHHVEPSTLDFLVQSMYKTVLPPPFYDSSQVSGDNDDPLTETFRKDEPKTVKTLANFIDYAWFYRGSYGPFATLCFNLLYPRAHDVVE